MEWNIREVWFLELPIPYEKHSSRMWPQPTQLETFPSMDVLTQHQKPPIRVLTTSSSHPPRHWEKSKAGEPSTMKGAKQLRGEI